MLDPSQSSGAGGRPWANVEWLITSTDDDNTTALSIMNYDLNTIYPTTRRMATISNTFLSVASYTVQLELTNFLGQSHTASAAVTVTNSAVQPKVSIDGKQKLSKYRSSSVSLFAIASVPVCEGADPPEGLTFTWKVYIGSMYVKSTEHQQRPTLLQNCPLQPRDQHGIHGVRGGGGGGATASKHVTVEVQSEGVQAAILGGAKRSGSTKSANVFESGSMDLTTLLTSPPRVFLGLL